MNDVLTPLVFHQLWEAERYAKHHRCGLCLGHLDPTPIDYGDWILWCFTCDASAYSHNTVTKRQALQAIDEITHGLRELRDPKPNKIFDEAEVLQALGF